MRVSLFINALKKPWVILLSLIIIGIVLCLILYFLPHSLERFVSLSYQAQLFNIISVSTLILIAGSLVFFTLSRLIGKEAYKANAAQGDSQSLNVHQETRNKITKYATESLQSLYGNFWHSKVSIQLLLGSHSAVEKLAPSLTQEIWQECDGTLLIYGGDIGSSIDSERLETLKHLRRRRPLDGVIWVTENSISSQLLDNNVTFTNLNTATAHNAGRAIQNLFQALGWRAPVWVWSVSDQQSLSAVETPSILCMTEQNMPAEALSPSLLSLIPALVINGTQALLREQKHTYLLALAQFLQNGGSQQLATALAPLNTQLRTLPFSGIAFSPSINPLNQQRLPNSWHPDTRWQSWLNVQSELASGLQPASLGFDKKRLLQYGAATAMTLWGAGMIVSYFANRQLIEESYQSASVAANSQLPETERLKAQYDFQQTLGLLTHREQNSVPFWLHFGLNSNEPLLAHLWPLYQQTVLPPLRDNIRQQLEQRLQAYTQLSPNSDERRQATQRAYQDLKTYLMMSTPERMEPAFFTDSILTTLPAPQGMDEGEWHTLGKELLMFYAQQLPKHPGWQLSANNNLINQSRTLLIRQIGQRSESASLYQKVLLQAQNQFPDMTLNDMTNDTDVSFLLTTEEFVPGIFTRKAWEESIQPAIKKVVESRRNEIDWVLSDNQHELSQEISPDVLKQQLTERYFADFSSSWLNFLNSLQWRQTDSLSDTIDQLTLMSDVRQSPVIALMNTLAYQGKTGRQAEKLADSFVNSAKELLNKEQKPVINQKADFTGPLEETFGPILNFVDPQATSQTGDNLSLQAYLTRITRVRLKLQQVVNAPDPQAMSQAFAQSILEGKSVDFAQTRDMGSLIAASFGQEWQPFGDALLVEPMTQAWQQLLTPTAQGINSEWQNAIVNEWNNAFGGRYPLKDTQSDISLPLMAQYLRPDSGRIQRFLETRLQGVLRKEGNHWVPNSTNAQGLRFNPEFIQAMNTLSELGDVAFANGEARLYFEMRPGTSKQVMQTILVIDKQNLTYDNQFPQWQRFVWPADTVASGASLSWMTTSTGTRLYGDHRGVWGLIRLLETANVAPYAGSTSSYTVSWVTPDSNTLNYQLRTEMGQGPLALLKLRNFVLPEKIFLD
ncbi:type VI secretion protein VasK [Providencia rettgeri]|uniref:ImcF-related family protein n=1 Tax=Providencia rettgeri TaxID=587 RepID=UPI00206E4658|nr:ImcF-related family protein [Providencia rettgeri]UPQ40847.1 type VI secretion protein VasK [Providencia rettgeri]